MYASWIQMMFLVPRQFLARVAAIGLVSVALVAVSASPAPAKQDPEVKRIKRELVSIQERVDEETTALHRLGHRWDAIEARTTRRARGLAAFVGTAIEAAEQQHVETLILDVRTQLDVLEERQEDTIDELERIVVQRQKEKLKRSGVSPASVPSISVSGSLVTYSADWEKTSMCESSGRWHIDSRYDGGLQFDPITWIQFGGAEFARYAYQATKLQQIAVAERVLAIQGPGAWPICFHPLQADT